MTLGQKLQIILKERGYKNPSRFHKEIQAVYKESSITDKTLYRILNDETAKERSLSQIAYILGMKTTDLRSGTPQEIKKEPSPYLEFNYNPEACVKIFKRNTPFLPQKLTIKHRGKTSLEFDAPDKKESIKWFVVTRGEIDLVYPNDLGENRRTFKCGEEYAFDARKRHYFQNLSSKNTVCIIYLIHYPRENSFCNTILKT